MDPFTWALIYWLGVAAALYFGAQKALELWPLDPPQTNSQSAKLAKAHDLSSQDKLAPIKQQSSVNSTYDEQREAKHRDIIDQQRQKILEQQHQLSNLQESLQSLTVNYQQANAINAVWVNSIIAWLYSHYNGSNEILRATWLKSMNDSAKKVAQSCSCELTFEDIQKVHSTRSPTLSDIKAEQGPREHLTLIANINIPELGINMVCTQQKNDELLVANYDVLILELSGELHMRCACISNELFVMFCFNGRPNMRIVLNCLDKNAVTPDVEAVDDALRRCIISCVTNVNMHQLQHDRRCNTITPQQSIERASSLKRQPVQHPATTSSDTKNHISITNLNTIANTQQMIQMSRQSQQQERKAKEATNATLGSRCPHPKHIWIKVIRGQHLGSGEDVQQPVVCMEMDEPACRMETTKSLSINPYWEEEFVCEINDKSSEMLFEVYDAYSKSVSGEPRFLGLAIVSLSELKASNSGLKNLQLQPRPYYNDPASGSIVVEFDLLPENSSEVGRIMREMQRRNQNTTTVHLQPLLPPTTVIHHERSEGNRIINEIIVEEASQTDSLNSTKGESTEVGERLEVTRRPLQMSHSNESDEHLQSQKKIDNDELSAGQMIKSVSGVGENTRLLDEQYFQADDKSPGPSSPTPLNAKQTMVKSKSLETDEMITEEEYEAQHNAEAIPVPTITLDNSQAVSPLDSYFREESEDAAGTTNMYSMPTEERAPTAASFTSNSSSQQDTVVHVQTRHEYQVPIRPPMNTMPRRDIIDNAWTPINLHEEPMDENRSSRPKRVKSLKYTDNEPHLTNQPERVPSRSRSRPREHGGFFRTIKDRISMRRSTNNKAVATGQRPRARSYDQSNRYKTTAAYSKLHNDSERSSSLPRSPKAEHAFDEEHFAAIKPIKSHESVLSVVSNRSVYVHSTLIVETLLDGQPKYYLIPQSMLDNHEARKLMRKGRKLHVFNEHIFIAVRARAGTNCNVCGQTLRRSFGRQAYQCRDCHLVCHKRCHYTTDTYCQQSGISNLQIPKRRRVQWSDDPT